MALSTWSSNETPGANASRDMEAFINHYWIPGVVDQIGEMSVLLKLLLRSNGLTVSQGAKKPGLSNMVTGGDKIKRSLRVARSTARASIWGYDTLPVDPNRQFDYALFPWRMYAISLPQAFTDMIQARGKDAVGNWMQDHMSGIIADHLHDIAVGMYNSAASRTGQYQSKGLNGLRELCSIDRTWGNIDSTTYTWWDPGFYDTTAYVEADMVDPNHASYLLDKIRDGLNYCRHAGRTANYIITSEYIYDLIEKELEIRKIYRPGEDGEMGFQYLSYRGVKIIAEDSDYFPDNYHMFFLRIEANGGNRAPLNFKGQQGNFFTTTGWKEPTNQLARVRQLYSVCCLYCDEPRLFGAYTGLGSG